MVAKLVVYNRAPGGPQWYLTATWNTISPDSFRPSTAQGHLGSTWFDGMRTHAYTLYIYMFYMLCIYIYLIIHTYVYCIYLCVCVFFLGGSIHWTSLTSWQLITSDQEELMPEESKPDSLAMTGGIIVRYKGKGKAAAIRFFCCAEKNLPNLEAAVFNHQTIARKIINRKSPT